MRRTEFFAFNLKVSETKKILELTFKLRMELNFPGIDMRIVYDFAPSLMKFLLYEENLIFFFFSAQPYWMVIRDWKVGPITS
jgi:hypothetical protein